MSFLVKRELSSYFLLVIKAAISDMCVRVLLSGLPDPILNEISFAHFHNFPLWFRPFLKKHCWSSQFLCMYWFCLSVPELPSLVVTSSVGREVHWLETIKATLGNYQGLPKERGEKFQASSTWSLYLFQDTSIGGHLKALSQLHPIWCITSAEIWQAIGTKFKIDYTG